ncbi:MAG: hypothetical protein WCX46_03600 [Candidatus Paceibacterota bacterium]
MKNVLIVDGKSITSDAICTLLSGKAKVLRISTILQEPPEGEKYDIIFISGLMLQFRILDSMSYKNEHGTSDCKIVAISSLPFPSEVQNSADLVFNKFDLILKKEDALQKLLNLF